MANLNDFDFYCEEAISGKTPVKKLYESEKVLAFYHTKPKYETHIMVIPKEHIWDLIHLEEKHKNTILEIIEVAKSLAKKLDIENKGARLVTNMGKFQETPHLHFHLVSGGLTT